MNFVSLTYAVFLALIFGAYWSIGNRRAQNLLLLCASYTFYAWWDWRFMFLMLSSTIVDYLVGLGLGSARRPIARRALLIVSLSANLGLLGFFKYADFFIENLVSMLRGLGMDPSVSTLRIILPVGISFYTFQTLSYTIDIYRGKISPTRSPLDFAAFVSFFPQLVAGPIERASNLLPQFQHARTFDTAAGKDGLRLILWGLFKKAVIADNLATFVDPVYSDPSSASAPSLVIATVAFAFQIYCDFSGYSDIAIGSARLFGIRLMRNFALPYFSRNPAEFWRRWHISLSTWFRDYVYIPLGGNRSGRVRAAINCLLTFVLSGFWHGASWNFVIWGGMNGAAVTPGILSPGRDRRLPGETPGGERFVPRLPDLGKILTTFAFICCTWVFFRAATLGDAMTVYGRVFLDPSAWRAPTDPLLVSLIDPGGALPLTIHLVILIVLEWITRRRMHPLEGITRIWKPVRWSIYIVLLIDFLVMGTKNQGAFIYFQF